MKLYVIEENGSERICCMDKTGMLCRLKDMGADVGDMNELIAKMSPEQLGSLEIPDDAERIPLEKVKLCAPIQPKRVVICLGVNYKEHIEETTHVEDFQHKEATVYFSKRVSRASGCGDVIPSYHFVDSLDYEAELGVILGKSVKDISREDAVSAIFGYTVINDVSARNLQFRHKQWFRGKSLDGYTPIGPCIVTADEIADIQSLRITCKVNGELRQNSNTSLMIQPVLDAVAELSQGMTLEAGTVISTGTPGGVALGMKPPVYLKSGDVIECEIEGIGRLVNTVG